MGNGACETIAASRSFTLGEVRVEFQGARASSPAPPGEASSGRYRPLSGARTLPSGWRISLLASLVGAALDAVYPYALLHQQLAAEQRLRTVSLADVVRRQRGRYRLAGELTDQGGELAQAVLCRRCVHTPVWGYAPKDSSATPFPETCSVLLALCREAAVWQQERLHPAAPDPTIPLTNFSPAGNELRKTYLADVPAGTPRG